MNTPSEDPVEPENRPIQVKAKVRLVDNWHTFVSAVAPILTVASFVIGFLFNAHQAKLTQAQAAAQAQQAAADARALAKQTADETNAAAWRSALQKVTFDESSLVSTAFLMETFDGNPDANVKNSALQIERTVLYETQRPETFDLVFFNMLPNLQTSDDWNNTLPVLNAIQMGLTQLWRAAIKQHLTGSEPQTFEYFLMKPTRFYSPKTQSAELNHVYVLIWQWDTFSAGVACFFDTSDNDCQHPAATGVHFETVTIVKQEPPHSLKAPPSVQLKIVETCDVVRDQALGTYYCKNAPDNSGAQ
jgi:hypothetical protein